jgi:hypothetical protein
LEDTLFPEKKYDQYVTYNLELGRSRRFPPLPTRGRRREMTRRQVVLLVLAMAAALVFASGAALALTPAKDGTTSPTDFTTQALKPDANCPGPKTANFNGVRRVAQPFTAQHNGKLKRAQVEIGDSTTGGNYFLEIHTMKSGVPTNNTLASTNVSAQVPTNDDAYATVTGVFANPTTVAKGKRYALVVRGSSSEYAVGGRFGDPCPEEAGIFFYSTLKTGPFTQSAAGAPTLVFATFVNT